MYSEYSFVGDIFQPLTSEKNDQPKVMARNIVIFNSNQK